CCSGCSCPSFSSPSTVVISAPSACTPNMVQDFTGRPFSSTVHAPQYEVSQPMWVPVRSRSSRIISTSSSRGSTESSHAFPFTFTLMGTRCASGINVADLHLFSASAAGGYINGLLQQRCDERSFVLGGAAHVGLRIGGRARCVRRGRNLLWRQTLPS